MLIPLRSGTPYEAEQNSTGVMLEAYVYTCRHLQLNGDCGIYEDRPAMCRDYPYGQVCEFPN